MFNASRRRRRRRKGGEKEEEKRRKKNYRKQIIRLGCTSSVSTVREYTCTPKSISSIDINVRVTCQMPMIILLVTTMIIGYIRMRTKGFLFESREDVHAIQ